MSPILRDILIFAGAAVAAHFLLVGPLLALMFFTGAPLVTILILAGILIPAVLLDRKRNFAARGIPATAAMGGIAADVGFLIATSEASF